MSRRNQEQDENVSAIEADARAEENDELAALLCALEPFNQAAALQLARFVDADDGKLPGWMASRANLGVMAWEGFCGRSTLRLEYLALASERFFDARCLAALLDETLRALVHAPDMPVKWVTLFVGLMQAYRTLPPFAVSWDGADEVAADIVKQAAGQASGGEN